jgi:HEPN domain-containing protein
MRAESRKEVLRWILFSEEDYAVAERVAEDFPRSGVWGYQQASEKALKALLIAYGKEFPKTHDLVALCEKLADVINVEEELFKSAAVLNSYGPSRRYPDDLILLKQADVTEAKNAALLICGFVKVSLDQAEKL